MALQTEYQAVVQDACSRCKEHFANRLNAIYLAGSVGSGEALVGYSDVDYFAILSGEPLEEDRLWATKTAMELLQRYPQSKEFHLNLLSTKSLCVEQMLMKFIFRYNSTCLHGEDFLSQIEQSGISIPQPSPQLARGRIGWMRHCYDGLISGHLPRELFQGAIAPDLENLSPNDYLASRKIMRHFILLEGAFVLMLTGHFESFKNEEVLHAIASLYPQWQNLCKISMNVMRNPFAEKLPPSKAAEISAEFAGWALNMME